MTRTSKLILFAYSALALAPLSAFSADIPRLSDDATISLLTLWPGNEIYLAFGHSALRVQDPEAHLDLIFNYGTFDFSDKLFVPKFVKGYLNYYLAYYPFAQDFKYDKRTQNRTWREQVLNLNSDQATALYLFLLDNARPEKRFYRYDFILDNCATRIRDALQKVLGSDVSFDPQNTQVPHKTFRQMINEFVADRPFYRFMFYFALGMASDVEVTSYQSQFLPLYMMKVFSASTVQRNGRTEPLVRTETIIYSPAKSVYRGNRWSDPAFYLWPCAALTLLFAVRSVLRLLSRHTPIARTITGRVLDFLLFLAVGLAGSLAFYLTVFSVHAAAQTNLTVIWFLPTNLFAAFIVVRRKPMPKPLSLYFAFLALLCAGLLLAWPLWPQPMHPAMIPILLMVASRALLIYLSCANVGNLKSAPRASGSIQ